MLRSRDCGAAERPLKVSCRLPLPHMNQSPLPILSEWEKQSWRATCLGDRHWMNERKRKRKHGILRGSVIQVLSEKLHSNLVKEWKGSVVWSWVTFPLVFGCLGPYHHTDETGTISSIYIKYLLTIINKLFQDSMECWYTEKTAL